MIKRLTLFISLFLVFSFEAFSQNYFWDWARSSKGVSQVYCYNSVVDKNGNVFVTGNFFGDSLTFNNITIKNCYNGFSDVFLVKYDSTGKVIWAKSFGGSNQEAGIALAADLHGDVYLTGWFWSNIISFGTKTLTNTQQYLMDVFVVKISGVDGDLLWAQSAGGVQDDRSLAATTDKLGNVYIGGTFKSPSITFGTNTLVNANPGYEDIFLIKFDSAGNILKARSFGGGGPDGVTGLATDDALNVYMTGSFLSPTIAFGPFTISCNGQSDMFLVKIDSSGNVPWVKNAGGTNYDAGLGVAVDKNKNVYVCGYFKSSAVSFDTLNLVNSGANTDESYLVKVDPAGNILWAKTIKGSGDEDAVRVFVDTVGNPYIAGNYGNTGASVDSVSLTSAGSHDIFVVKYDPSGKLVAVLSAGGAGSDDIIGGNTDANGNIYLAGSFASPQMVMGNNVLSAVGGFSMFLAKVSTNKISGGSGIPNTGNDQFKIFPNPSKGKFTVSLPLNFVSGTVEVYSLFGQKIFSGIVTGQENNIDLEHVSSGVYFVKVNDGVNLLVQRIVIE